MSDSVTSGVTSAQADAIRHFLQSAETVVVATSAAETLRLRMMHLGFQDDFTVYLASMRNDPKVIQMTNHPAVTLLANRLPDDVNQSEEVEYNGKALLIRDPQERQ